ncbi:hypothetical protein [Engelhardtia mirabilis]|uniref:DUF1570 domain-containing protein n=1 Tax=Engelhardtia mirabilis TaxID=2528011 RepID=A0A518BKS9_9BACT|nr:hypothetical protein Pla133_26670 [Planctomycetes bacterium Pla133]QDV01905.1 hypothetical protein Pla86_26660 [Planctomycetes bacterium Pla86]
MKLTHTAELTRIVASDRSARSAADPALLGLALAAGMLIGTAPSAAAQYRDDDARDRLLMTDGDEIFGRLLWENDPEGEVHFMLPKGRVKHIDKEDVLQIETVTDTVGAFLSVRSPSASIDEDWALVEWARDNGLDGLAQAQAYHVLTRNPNEARAHEFLGHRERNGKWKWAADDGARMLDAEDWAEWHRDTGHPLELHGEHYVVRSTAELTQAVDLLFDLERMYVDFQAEFGAISELQTKEVVRRPMTAWIYRDVERFPATGSAKVPYYAPGLTLSPSGPPETGSGNEIRTYYGERGNYPLRFFELAAQQLLYSCVLGETQTVWSDDWSFYREAAWLEVGFGNWFGGQFDLGRPGFVKRKDFALDPDDVLRSRSRADRMPLNQGRHELTSLIGLNYEFFLQNEFDERRDIEARAHTFVAYLLDPDTRMPEGKREGQRTRPALMEYMRAVYLTSKGSSSSALDDALGTKIENLEKPWKQWLLSF